MNSSRQPTGVESEGSIFERGLVMRSMSWVFTGLMKRARDFERERVRRLNEAYARWHKKYRERKRREREQRKPRK
jgi:hypothetical protein